MECIKYQLGDICKISAGQGAPQGEDKYTDTGTPFIKAGNLLDLVYGLDETKVQQVKNLSSRKCYICKKWCFLLERICLCFTKQLLCS